jgi:hypothetical protein
VVLSLSPLADGCLHISIATCFHIKHPFNLYHPRHKTNDVATLSAAGIVLECGRHFAAAVRICRHRPVQMQASPHRNTQISRPSPCAQPAAATKFIAHSHIQKSKIGDRARAIRVTGLDFPYPWSARNSRSTCLRLFGRGTYLHVSGNSTAHTVPPHKWPALSNGSARSELVTCSSWVLQLGFE